MSNDVVNNIFLCTGSFDNDMLKSFVDFYKTLVKENKKQAFIYIDSPGGFVHVANAMLSIIEGSEIVFHTVAIGQACSCGCVLLAGADYRYATDRADIMFHDIAAAIWGHPEEMEFEIKRIKLLSSSFMDKFAKRTKKTKKWWLDKAKSTPVKEFWFKAKEAKTLGVVDYIGLPKFDSAVQLKIK